MLVLHEQAQASIGAVKRAPGFYILHGPRGIGKKTALLAHLPQAFTQILEPTQAGSIKVADVRAATALLHVKKQEQWYLVVDDAHAMTTYAQNALLKVLEELPERVSIIMLTDNLSGLLVTVRSRAQTYNLPAPSSELVASWLQEHQFDGERAHKLLQIVGPYPGLLAPSLEDVATLTAHERVADYIQRLCLGDDLSQRFQAAAELTSQVTEVMPRIMQYVRSLVYAQPSPLHQQLLVSCEYAQRLLHANVNKRVVLDVIALRMSPS